MVFMFPKTFLLQDPMHLVQSNYLYNKDSVYTVYDLSIYLKQERMYVKL